MNKLKNIKVGKMFLLLCSILLIVPACDKGDADVLQAGGSNTGKAGSMSKFTIKGNFLYVVQGNYLMVYDVSEADKTVLVGSVNLNNDAVETIFCNDTYLFFGTANGMLIYGLNDPAKPDYISTYTHVVACDPVVVSGNLAYVTLSSGTACGGNFNQLEVIDISNIHSPKVLKVYEFDQPKGMAISGNYLYLCDLTSGFKVLDISNHLDIQEKHSLPAVKANDVIQSGDILTITGPSGVFQYDCSNPLDLKFISKINAN